MIGLLKGKIWLLEHMGDSPPSQSAHVAPERSWVVVRIMQPSPFVGHCNCNDFLDSIGPDYRPHLSYGQLTRL
jgi:hypothetical protein